MGPLVLGQKAEDNAQQGQGINYYRKAAFNIKDIVFFANLPQEKIKYGHG